MQGNPEQDWGVSAYSRSGDIEITVCETCSGPERWQLTLEDRRFHLTFDIPNVQSVGDFLGFLNRFWQQSPWGEFQLGSVGNATVCIVKDEEFVDRFFIKVLGDQPSGGIVSYTLTEEVPDLVKALESVLVDLTG
jgi:hypothetical protein